MKITHIVTETTTAGSVATVATPLFKQSRKGGNLLTGTKTKKKYANSVNEGKVKELQMDLSRGVNGLSDEEFKQKYGKTKQEMRKLMGPPSKPQSNPQSSKQVDEAKLDEEDLILVPGMGRRLKSGFISNKEDRTDHEVEMARSDLFQSAKNAKKVYELISNISEEQGLEGWVQEKIIKANDYLNTIREYLEHKVMTKEGMAGRLAGGAAGALITRTPMGAVTGAGIGSDLEDMFREATMGAGVIAGGPQYEGVAEGDLTPMQKLKKLAAKNDPTKVPRGYELTAHGQLVKKSKTEKPNQGVGGQGVTEAAVTDWHGSNTDMKWYDAYKNQPVRVKIKNHSGIGSNPAGTYTVRSFKKIDATKAELTINTRMMGEMTGTVDLDNPQTVVTKKYDRVPAMDFYLGSMPVTPRQAFNMFQYKNKQQGVAEGFDNPYKEIDPTAWHLIQGDKPIAINFPDENRAKSFHSGHGYGRETKVLHGSQVRRNAYLKHNPGVINWPEYSKGVAEGSEPAPSQMYKMGWNDGVEDEINDQLRQDPEYIRGFRDGLNHAMGPRGLGRSNPRRYGSESGVAEGSKLDRLMRKYVPGSAKRQIDDKIKDQQFTQLIAKDGDPNDPQNQKEIHQTQRNIRRLNRVGQQGVAEGKVTEKAVSKAQQKFMGMVHATQKGEKPASSEVAKVAKSMPKKAAKDFAQTKHKGLPQHVGKKDKE